MAMVLLRLYTSWILQSLLVLFGIVHVTLSRLTYRHRLWHRRNRERGLRLRESLTAAFWVEPFTGPEIYA